MDTLTAAIKGGALIKDLFNLSTLVALWSHYINYF